MKTDGLDLNDDPEMEKKLRPFQMIAKWALVCFVAAAVLGFFGKSDLSLKKIQSGDSVFEYPKILRQQTSDDLTFKIAGPFSGSASLWLTQEYLNDADVDHINPPPVKTESVGNRVRFEFAANGPDPINVVFSIKPRSAGFLRGEVQLSENSAPVSFQQFSFY